MNDAGPRLSPAVAAEIEAGRRLFNDHRYWRAHEAWETAWHALDGEIGDLVQGLIQVAAMLEQYERMKPRGVRNIWAKASPRLVPGLGASLGLDVDALVAALAAYVEPVLAGDETMALRPADLHLARLDPPTA